MNTLANAITSLSLFCGFFSIIFSLERHFTFACWAIILSVIFDGLDGRVARRNPVPSEFGKQLDSLVDAVAFGIAPAMLGYIFIYRQFRFWATITLLFYLFCSVWRLAKYNITPKEKMQNFFLGLPTTACGALLAAFILIFRNKAEALESEYLPHIFLGLTLLLSLLMISRIRYLNIDGIKKFMGKRTPVVISFLAGLYVAAGSFKKIGITTFSLFFIYLLFSPFVVKRLNAHS